MKVGLIRCLQTENVCPAAHCFKVMRDKSGSFSESTEEIQCVAVNTCGGCPGKNAAHRAKNMVKQGAEAIAIASCISLGTPNNFPCPFHHKLIETVKEAVGENIKVLEYTHESKKKSL